jgi:hypothetical protein
MKNLKAKLTAAMMALVLSVLLLVHSPNTSVFVMSIVLILIQGLVWGKLLENIKE